jgi:ADP-heptose:LPS heptosyltransferase
MATGGPKFALITIDDEGFREIADRTVPSMRRYADAFGLQFFEFSAEAHGRPPAWAKILRIREILQSGFDWCLYVDADTMFVRFDQDIRDQIDKVHDLHLCWHDEGNSEIYAPLSGHFNTGVMAWRSSEWSLNFLDEIWHKEEFINHHWWEQAAVNSLLGYRSVLDPKISDAPVAHHRAHVQPLSVNWNAVVGRTIAPDPVIVVFAGVPWPVRLAAIDRETAAQTMRQILPPDERHLLSRYMNQMLYQDLRHHQSTTRPPLVEDEQQEATDGRTRRHSQSPTVFLADRLLSMRHRIAPAGSRREQGMRAIYVPLIRWMAERQRQKAVGIRPEVRVEFRNGLGMRSAELRRNPRILVLKLDHLGDFVVALRAFEQLREVFPDATITLVCGSWNRAWAEQCGLFDKVIVFDFFTAARGGWRGPGRAQFDAFRALPLESYDLAIDLRHDSDTRRLLTLVKAEFRAGFRASVEDGGDRLDIAFPDTENVSPGEGTGRPLHAEVRLLLLVTAVTATLRPHGHPADRLICSDAAQKVPTRPYAVIAPGAGSPIKLWPTDRFVAVARALQDRHGLNIVVAGGTREREAARAIAGSLSPGGVINLAESLSLSELPDVIRQARVYVGLDTGTTHLAAALGVPTIGIISGVPNLDVWQVLGRNVTVVTGRVACSPCHLSRPQQCRHGVICLNSVTADHVISACEALLQPQRSASSAQPVI